MAANYVIDIGYREIVDYKPYDATQEDIEIDQKEVPTPVEVNAAASRLCEETLLNKQFIHKTYGDEGAGIEYSMTEYLALSGREKMELRGGLSNVSIEETILALDILDFYAVGGRNYQGIFRDVATVFYAYVEGIEGIDFPNLRDAKLRDAIRYVKDFLSDFRDDIQFRREFAVVNETLFKTCLTLGQYIMFLRENDHILYLGPASIPGTFFENAVETTDGELLDARIGHARVDVLGIVLGEHLPFEAEERSQEVQRRLELAWAIHEQANSYEAVALLEAASQFDIFPIVEGVTEIQSVIIELKRRIERPGTNLKRNFQVQAGGYTEKLTRSFGWGDMFGRTQVTVNSILATIYPRDVELEGIDGLVFWLRLKEVLRAKYAEEMFRLASAEPRQMELDEIAPLPEVVPLTYEGMWREYQMNCGVIYINTGWSKSAIEEARSFGFRVVESKKPISEPDFLPENWYGTLKWWFPSADDSLLALLTVETEPIQEVVHGPSKELADFYVQKARIEQLSMNLRTVRRVDADELADF